MMHWPWSIRSDLPARHRLGAALLLAALGTLGCSKQLTRVDPGYTLPEGRFSPKSLMVIWYDAPAQMFFYDDIAPPGSVIDDCGRTQPGFGDILIGSIDQRRYGTGSINGVIFDGTPATNYQVLRREAGGGLRVFQDFTAERTKRWLSSGWELYRFNDPLPSSFTPPTYIGRGEVMGVVTPQSPLSNMGELGSVPVADINYTGACNPTDSLFTISWDPVAGAVRYFIQVYTFRGDLRSILEKVLSGTPSPVYDGQSEDLFVGFVAGSNTSYKLGDSTRTDVTILHQRIPQFAVEYLVRVAAVDAEGELIAYTNGDYAVPLGISDTQYALYRLGAVRITANRRRSAGAGLEAATPTGHRRVRPLVPTSVLYR